MLYLERQDLDLVFNIIAQHYTSKEEIPDYWGEQEGIERLLGVFERVRMEHYQSLIDKVVYLFIQINKGHFFSNGNKRLSLVSAIGFLIFNDRKINDALSRSQFKEILLSIFPECDDCLEDRDEFTPGEFALYNLSIIVADSHKYVTEEEGFDVLKDKVSEFFTKVVIEG